ncbi:hypothetical protein [Shewanella sairae]|uniref:hypothetical protein n=1 Tax=Shewanella sairae TaxID=190310 RepID=UPI001C7EDB80|nr:hypothetical protein [Shewanella sairae]MCL1132492.1 hypothetical protein [Shewanella sairae]
MYIAKSDSRHFQRERLKTLCYLAQKAVNNGLQKVVKFTTFAFWGVEADIAVKLLFSEFSRLNILQQDKTVAAEISAFTA